VARLATAQLTVLKRENGAAREKGNVDLFVPRSDPYISATRSGLGFDAGRTAKTDMIRHIRCAQAAAGCELKQ
jgi:hypothetical protein